MIRKKVWAVMLTVIIVCMAFSANIMPVHAGTDPWVGEIQLYPYTYAPRGWPECAGQVININANNALFALIGNRFGGDGISTFALPDLRGMEPTKDLHYCIATSGSWPKTDDGSNDYLGDIKLLPYDFDPIGYIHCDGRLLNISEYGDLFNLIGAAYGGDGVSTFKLPDMRSMEPDERTRYCIQWKKDLSLD